MTVNEPIFIFANPISGRGLGLRIAARLERRLTSVGYTVRVFLQRADTIRSDQLSANASAAIIIGGDGTLRAVAERLLQETQLPPKPRAEAAGDAPGSSCSAIGEKPGASPTASASGLKHSTFSMPPLLIIPMGTANLMGQHLNIRWDDANLENQIVATLRAARLVHLDTATANGRLLLLIAGVGLDAEVVHVLQKSRTGPISYASYVLPILQALNTYQYPALSVTLDGTMIFKNTPALVFVGNIPEYGTGFPLLPLASSTNGLLDVCILPCRCREEAMAHVLRAAAGEHLHGEGVIYQRGQHIRIESETPIPVQVDGESAGHTPLAIDLLPTRLTFIVPPA